MLHIVYLTLSCRQANFDPETNTDFINLRTAKVTQIRIIDIGSSSTSLHLTSFDIRRLILQSILGLDLSRIRIHYSMVCTNKY